MTIKQEHNSQGDNVARDKFEENNYYSSNEFDNPINSKITFLEQSNKLDFTDDIVIKAIKETLIDLIKEEQEKCHNIVPIGTIRNKYKSYIQDDFFAQTMKELNVEKNVEINNVQVCFVPKDLHYTIDI